MTESTKPLTASQKKLQSMGLVTPMDLALHLPLRYEDHSQIHTVDAIVPGMTVQLEGVIKNVNVHYYANRKSLSATFEDHTGSIQLRWIHFYGNQKTQLEKAGLVRIRGEVRGSLQWGLEIIHPKMLKAGAELGKALVPIYSTTQGLSQEFMQKVVQHALQTVDLSDTLPSVIREQLGLMPFDQAVRTLHHPPLNTDIDSLIEHTHPAWQRLKYDEIFAQQIAMTQARQERHKLKAYPIETLQTPDLYRHVLNAFGYALTAAQERVIAQIIQDMQKSYPMHRLIQGDVGSGKTIVATLAASFALAAGFQVALMAPTEILAEQHFLKIQSWFEGTGIQCVWLSGSLKAKEKRLAQESIATGQAQFVVGTQALIQKGVEFAKLGLLIIDEQHRFGVGQRLTLSKKGEHQTYVPHQLSMSATPIPRSLAMTFLADLDVSVIDELPPGRQAVITRLISNLRRQELIDRLAVVCPAGQQAYWVCPLVEESEVLQLETAVNTHEQLSQELPQCRIGLVHGRLPSVEKNQIMQDFKDHKIDILVATTVIEVGVDVPNANIMVIEHAERFGLAQLHQLRGRVGRGQQQAVCMLMYQEPLSKIAKDRLTVMRTTNDGFEIARRDLEQRGPGEFLGVRQSGVAMMRFSDLEKDIGLVETARELTPLFLKDYPRLALTHRQRWVKLADDYLRS